jgi:hypothetical protein
VPEAIFGDILQSLGRDAGPAIAVLQRLDTLSGGPFADLDAQRRDAIAGELCVTGGGALAYLTRIILQCYYRDDRAMGRWARNRGRPFPKASKWNKAIGPCWIRYVRVQSFIDAS